MLPSSTFEYESSWQMNTSTIYNFIVLKIPGLSKVSLGEWPVNQPIPKIRIYFINRKRNTVEKRVSLDKSLDGHLVGQNLIPQEFDFNLSLAGLKWFDHA